MDNANGFIKDMSRKCISIDVVNQKDNHFTSTPNIAIECKINGKTRPATVWNRIEAAAKANGVLVSVRKYGGSKLSKDIIDVYQLIVVPLTALQAYRDLYGKFYARLMEQPCFLQEEESFIQNEWNHCYEVNQALARLEDTLLHIRQVDIRFEEKILIEHWAFFQQNSWSIVELIKDQQYAQQTEDALKGLLQVFGVVIDIHGNII